MNLSTGWTYDWYAKYIIENGDEIYEYDDVTTLRAFTMDEMSLFLKLTSFKTKEIFEDGKTFTIISEKMATPSD